MSNLTIFRTDDGNDGEVYFDLFSKRIPVVLETEDIPYAEQCAEELKTIQDSVIDALCEASIRYCNTFLESIDEPQIDFQSRRGVLKSIYPSLFLIPEPNDERETVIHLELNCEWEIEHGMEWVVRSGRVLYVGAFNGEDPFDDFEPKMDWNFA